VGRANPTVSTFGLKPKARVAALAVPAGRKPSAGACSAGRSKLIKTPNDLPVSTSAATQALERVAIPHGVLGAEVRGGGQAGQRDQRDQRPVPHALH